MTVSLHFLPQFPQGNLDMPPCCAAWPANTRADHALRLMQKVIAQDFFPCLLR